MQDFNRYTSQVDLSPVIDFTLQTGTEKHYRKGDWFVRQGDLCRTIGFVATGSFRYSCTDSAGEVKTVGYTFEKSFVGNYPALLQQVPSSIDIQALCDCTVYECTYHQLTRFLNRTQSICDGNNALQKSCYGKYMNGWLPSTVRLRRNDTGKFSPNVPTCYSWSH